MTSHQLLRTSGLSLVAGASAFVCYIVLRSVITAGNDPAAFAMNRLWEPVSALGVLGAVLVIIGLPGACVRLAGSGGLSGVIGFALLAVAWIFFGVFLSLYGLLIQPWLARESPSLVAASAQLPGGLVGAFIGGLLAWFAGALLLAIPFLRGRARPSWLGYLLVASALWQPIGNLMIAPSGPASDPGVNLLSNMGSVLLMVGLAYLGYKAWSEERAFASGPC
jgi:hypothetical protein